MTDDLTKSFCEKQAKICDSFDQIPSELYIKYDVKKGLRDKDGKGVVTGITSISRVDGFAVIDGVRTPIEGKLQYRGYNVPEIVANHEGRYGYEEAAYLLVFGQLPTNEQLEEFKNVINESSELPVGFVRDVILEGHSKDIMNSINKSILTLAAYDEAPSDNSIDNVLRQCIYIMSVMPQLAVYGYQAYRYYGINDSLIIHRPSPELSISENILRMLRPDGTFTELEAKILDIALILHMEHGGGNNSTFTARVITSAGSDTYSVIAAALSSLKGPKHGGANIKVVEMIDDIKAHVSDINDENEVTDYLIKILNKEAFDRQGLIYGMGHAVYSISDPRANVLKGYAEQLAKEKGRERDLKLYQIINKVAPELICSRRHAFTGVSANVDFYSGFIYNMLGIPNELFTPIFAVGRIVGWCAHRIEELISSGKIIRPAYVSIATEKEYVPLSKRD